MSKNLKNNSFSLQLVESDSLDEVFRYDDRLILGKRTNKLLQRKGNKNGYYDVQMLDSHNSTNSIDYISNKQWMNMKVNEEDIRKNENMMKHLQKINLEVQNFNSNQYEFEDFDNFQDSNQEIQLDDIQGQRDRIAQNSIKKIKELSENGLPTIEKSKMTIDEDVDKEKSTKSQKGKVLKQIEETKLIVEKQQLEEQTIQANKPMRKQKASRKSKSRGRARQSDEQQQEEPKKINIWFNPIKIQKNEIYEPQGLIRESRYPARLHVQPLRFWMNQRRSYTGGALSQITLINDKQGRRIRKQLLRQDQR